MSKHFEAATAKCRLESSRQPETLWVFSPCLEYEISTLKDVMNREQMRSSGPDTKGCEIFSPGFPSNMQPFQMF